MKQILKIWVPATLAISLLGYIGFQGYYHLVYAGAVEEVTFENGDIKLSGVLIRPNIEGRHPAIVMLHGSGPGTHDEMFFRIHTNVFVRQGFAVLSYR